MFAARIVYPLKVLGPGNRIGLWLAGCQRACPGCANPELWSFRESTRISVEKLWSLLEKACPVPDGYTITGGEPFLQAEELLQLVELMRSKTEDIIIYSGFTKEELIASENCRVILDKIAVLIDGPYIKARPRAFLRGSDNQRIHILDESIKDKYEEYIKTGVNQVQNFTIGQSVISAGIHEPNFREDLQARLAGKGLKKI
ncbi:MAG: radical SAM protein [bacterium]|nr:radical SAM protein [bacterium]